MFLVKNVAKKYIKIKNNKKWETGENRSAGIDNQKKDRVAVAVVVELVVGTESGERAETDRVWEENLSAGIDPDLKS